jgi:hypothetical protein
MSKDHFAGEQINLTQKDEVFIDLYLTLLEQRGQVAVYRGGFLFIASEIGADRYEVRVFEEEEHKETSFPVGYSLNTTRFFDLTQDGFDPITAIVVMGDSSLDIPMGDELIEL